MSQITILNQANVPMGPFTPEQVAEKLQRGEVTMSSLAFVDGLSQWTPLRDVLARMSPALPSVPAPLRLATAPVPMASVPAYSYAATMAPPAHLVYAGFWLRVAAILVDGLVFLPLSAISYYLQYESKYGGYDSAGAEIGLGLVLLAYGLFLIVARWLYFALLESSGWQATIGKKLVGIRVTGLDGNRIGFGRATGRYFGKIISAIILCIGFAMAGFTERKQALHDMIAGTLVVRN